MISRHPEGALKMDNCFFNIYSSSTTATDNPTGNLFRFLKGDVDIKNSEINMSTTFNTNYPKTEYNFFGVQVVDKNIEATNSTFNWSCPVEFNSNKIGLISSTSWPNRGFSLIDCKIFANVRFKGIFGFISADSNKGPFLTITLLNLKMYMNLT